MFFTPGNIGTLVFLVSLTIGIVYFLQLKQKSSDVKLLTGVLSVFLAYQIFLWFFDSYAAIGIHTTTGFDRFPFWATVTYVLMGLNSVLLVLYAYRIQFRFRRWEERILVIGSAIAMAWILGTFVARLPGILLSDTSSLGYYLTISYALTAWSFVVSLRKTWYAYRKKLPPETQKLLRVLVVTLLGWTIVSLSRSSVLDIRFSSDEFRMVVGTVGMFLVVALLIYGVLLYGADRHTVLAKLVGFLLLAYNILFIITTFLQSPDIKLWKEYSGDPDLSTLTFEPDSMWSYQVSKSTPAWIRPRGPMFTSFDDEFKKLDIPFSFPLYGQRYDTIYIGTNGVIKFEEKIPPEQPFSDGAAIFDEEPAVAPLFTDLIQRSSESGIRFDLSDSLVTISWIKASLFKIPGSINDFQALLYPDGRISFHYRNMSAQPLQSFVGVTPGGPQSASENFLITIQGSPGGALIVERDNEADFRATVSRSSIPLLNFAILGLLLLVFAGILFYRIGLIKPLFRVLGGLQQVEAGVLDASISISERNELGTIADYFNQMTSSLRSYANKMEELVAARTRDLETTISDLKTTQKQLVQAEKMASLGTLTAGIAHEIKNPLNFVNNFSEVNEELLAELRETLASGESVEEILDDLEQNLQLVRRHGMRADGIVYAMMQHASGGKGTFEETDINRLVSEHIDLAYHGKRAKSEDFHVEIDRNLDPQVGSVSIIPRDIGRVLLNLLGNAFDAVEEHQKESDDSFVPKITVATSRNGDEVIISVVDNGPGVPDEIIQKIFEPFFTTKSTTAGTGLGLSMSYDIIAQGHRGKMEVQNRPSGGATFTISLPIDRS